MVEEIRSVDTIKSGDVLVDFYTTTCGPCRAMHPLLEEISKEFQGVKVAKVEVTQNPEASQKFGVMSVPTVMFLRDSKVKAVSMGFSDKKKIRSMIVQNMS